MFPQLHFGLVVAATGFAAGSRGDKSDFQGVGVASCGDWLCLASLRRW